MTFNELKDELDSLRKEIKSLKSKIDYCEEQSYVIPGPMWGEEKINTQPSGKAPFEKWILKKLDLEKLLKEVEAKYEAKSIELTDFISSKISDEKMLMAILYRDVSFKSYEDISKAVNLSLSYVYKLHKMGIDELNKT